MRKKGQYIEAIIWTMFIQNKIYFKMYYSKILHLSYKNWPNFSLEVKILKSM